MQPTHFSKLELFPLMEEPPPVPPKDQRYTARMEIDHSPSAPASGSKRKREAHDDALTDFFNSNREAPDADQHTPKRSRPSTREGHVSTSDEATSAQHRNVKRKKGSRNLSNLNLRHAAEKQAAQEVTPRPSKFQEGSLTDKPSEKPPSFYMKIPRTDSGHSLKVDELMADYHEGGPINDDSIRATIEHEKAIIPQRVADINIETAKKEEGKGFFQFGRQWAASFHPVTLWQKLWNETKEEPTQKQTEEAERKVRLKADAEAKYAEMKRTGKLGLKPVGSLISGTHGSADGWETPRDSAVEIDGLRPSFEHRRSVSATSKLLPPQENTTSRSGSEVPDTVSKQNKGLKARLHLKKPSLTNIKSDLKRVKSEFNLTPAVRHRESSSSLSPVKADFENSALKRSQSKFDLKKQHKLSKRVSDLEVKLDQARKELDDALVEASPMPKLSGKYERFTPSSTIKRPKFVPGKLPSLPSERILMAQENGERGRDMDNAEAKPRTAMDLNEFMDDEVNEEQDTIKTARAKPYPIRASSMFNLENDDTDNVASTEPNDISNNKDSSEVKQLSTEDIENMDPNSLTNLTSEVANEPAKPADYSSLDAKLKALEENVKIASKAKAAKTKKRKSGIAGEDKPFKPGQDSDDDAEWEEAQSATKKRKAKGGKNDTSPQSPRTKTVKQSSPRWKKATGASARTNGLSSSPVGTKKRGQQDAIESEPEEGDAAQAGAEEYSADELEEAEIQPPRTSMDSQGHPLDPVYEEEENSSPAQLNGEPSKPATKATKARYGRHTTRSRSTSPFKRPGSVQPGVEELMITRAAEAAQKHPARRGGRSVSPPPARGYTKTTVVTETETVSVVPGEDGVPKLPRGANGSFETLDGLENKATKVEVLQAGEKRDSFEWPEDVF